MALNSSQSIKMNENEILHIDFTNNRFNHKSLYTNQEGAKRYAELKLKYRTRKTYWLLGRHSARLVFNVLL